MTFDSAAYWEERYRSGRNSGPGSYGDLAVMKSKFINSFVDLNAVGSIIDFGVGDGGFAASVSATDTYSGVDVARTVVTANRARFQDRPGFRFYLVSELTDEIRGDLGLSLDVIYHLIEDGVYEAYMRRLFDRAERFVIVYASNTEVQSTKAKHVRHRMFTRWVEENAPGWRMISVLPNLYPFDPDNPSKTSFADFHVFAKDGVDCRVPPLV